VEEWRIEEVEGCLGWIWALWRRAEVTGQVEVYVVEGRKVGLVVERVRRHGVWKAVYIYD
jgi:hypothetical protein